MDYPQRVQHILLKIVDKQLEFCQEILNAGLGITIFESAVSPPLLSPRQFRTIAKQPLNELLQEAGKMTGHALPCIIGGNTVDILEDILETGTSFIICPTETNQALFLQKLFAYPDVGVRVNTPPHIYCGTDFAPIRAQIDQIVSILPSRKNLCLGTSGLPYEANPDLVLRAIEYARLVNNKSN
jgi:uroporphyrinogen-III decarboxylase